MQSITKKKKKLLKKKIIIIYYYWVIADFPLRDRSSLSTIFLAALCKTQDVKTFGYDQIVKPLLKDLQLPDFLHDLLEGIVPFELCLCLKKND